MTHSIKVTCSPSEDVEEVRVRLFGKACYLSSFRPIGKEIIGIIECRGDQLWVVKKPGRQLGTKPKTKVTITIDVDVLAAIDGMAAETRDYRSTLVEAAMKDLVRKYREGRYEDVPTPYGHINENTYLTDGYIYFIQPNQDPFVKIGFANDPCRRLKELQTGNPKRLRLRKIAPGTMSDEKTLQKAFDGFQANDEWFHLTPEIKSYIDKIDPRVRIQCPSRSKIEQIRLPLEKVS